MRSFSRIIPLTLLNSPFRELAELLGQVKPPVATREDIDKSGLQVISAGDLEEYVSKGEWRRTVLNVYVGLSLPFPLQLNIYDQCLICLDDYELGQELRLMTCKHAFHKECVDKWLQVGRNNCPACRSKVSARLPRPHQK